MPFKAVTAGEKAVLVSESVINLSSKNKAWRSKVGFPFSGASAITLRWIAKLGGNLQTLPVCQPSTMTAFSRGRGDVYWHNCWLDTRPKCLFSIQLIQQVSTAWWPLINLRPQSSSPFIAHAVLFVCCCSPDVSPILISRISSVQRKNGMFPPVSSPPLLHSSPASPTTFFCLVCKNTGAPSPLSSFQLSCALSCLPSSLSAYGWHVMVALVCSLPLPLVY